MAVTNNLYPPVVDSYMPAFLISDNIHTETVTKEYTTLSYVNQEAYDAAVDQYIHNSDVDGVEELWEQYEIELAEIRAEYPDEDDPVRIELQRQLKIRYDRLLKELISGSANEDKTEDIFFQDRPDVAEVTKTATFETAYTTKANYICRVYFSLSIFNSLSEITNAQVTVRSQLTNLSVLHKEKYPCEIMLKQVKTDTSRTTNDKYYIEIKPEDLENCNFIVDQYYKVQIRFTSIDAEDPGIDLEDPDAVQAIDAWLTRNLSKFSEWSTVCLIRGISEPTVVLKDFDESSAIDIYDTIANTQIIGELRFADENETETLRSYRIKAYNSEDKLLLDSGDIFASKFTDINNFNYSIKYLFPAVNDYYFTLTFTTQNLYTETHRYDFTVIQAEVPDLNIQIQAYLDEDNGRIGLHVARSRGRGRYTGQVVIRRASNKDNFSIWEDVYTVSYDHVPYIDLTWYDYTVENGVLYSYGVQGIDVNGARTPMIMFKKPVMVEFDHIFLTGNNKQLKIRFNPSVTSFKRTINEVKTETIGSKYPFIKRNGYVDYVQFPLGGLISTAMDEEGLFTTKEEVYGDYTETYADYNEDREIKIYNDFIWEKFFRDKVSNFLYDDEVKLFRSPTEGNFLVKLMDINFQPNQTLGRRLWSFTANANEVDECTMENYAKYNIVTMYDAGTQVSGGDEPSTLTPIKRVVFIHYADEFPTEGKEGVIYIFNNDIYIWDTETSQYKLISVTIWNDEDDVDLSGLTGMSNRLYTDNHNLFMWDDQTEEYNPISADVITEG